MEGRGDFTSLTRQQSEIVVLPENWRDLVSAFGLAGFQAHEERNALARIHNHHMGDGIVTFALGMRGDIQLYFRQLGK